MHLFGVPDAHVWDAIDAGSQSLVTVGARVPGAMHDSPASVARCGDAQTGRFCTAGVPRGCIIIVR
jgi:hypothetical protein